MRLSRLGSASLIAAALALSIAPARAQPSAWQTVITLPETHSPVGVANGVAIDPRAGAAGTSVAYTVDTVSRRVVKFSGTGKVLLSWPLPVASNLRASLAVDAAGNVYVASGANYLYKYSPTGTLLSRWGKFGGLRGIALDRAGNVYLAQYQAKLVAERSPSGALVRRWSSTTLWHGGSAGSVTGLAVTPGGAVTISTTCLATYDCAPRIAYLAGAKARLWVDALLPLADAGVAGDGVGTVGLAHDMWEAPAAAQDTCNNRFVSLQSMTTSPSGRMYVAGVLWPRGSPTAELAVGLGSGEPGCTHAGIGPGWTTWELPGQINYSRSPHINDDVHGLAVDAAGTIYVAQDNHILKLAGRDAP
jgi:DNA-binding beta-propeller fold protein YncE